MPTPLRRRNKYITNLDMPCSGVDCRTPQKALPHTHRKRLSCRTLEEFNLKTAEMQLTRKQLKQGIARGEIVWSAFKIKFMIYSRGKNPQTHYRDKLAIRYLERYYPISQLKQITPELLTSLKGRLQEDAKGKQNINRILTALKAMMRFAEISKLIDAQVWRLTRPIPTPKGRLHYWQTDETTALYARCRGTWLTIAMLAIEAGLRREEIRSLKTENLDFARNRIHIVGDDEWIPKDFERRWVPMKPALAKHLKKVKRGELHVLLERPTLGTMTNYFRRLVEEAGLTGSLHTGRHTYGSHLAMNGIPLLVIKERMGHASIKTTEIYAHLCPDKTQALYAA